MRPTTKDSQKGVERRLSGGRSVLLHKPYGFLSQFTPEPGSRYGTLADLVPVTGIYAAGRLDADSEGLLLLTSDGELQHALTSPRIGHPRTYWVQVEGMAPDEAVHRLASGLMLKDGPTLPAEARVLPEEPTFAPRVPPIRFRASIPTCWLEITLKEGRNRQVRRMTAAIGFPTLRLVRVGIGPLQLESLAPGEWRDLSAEEIRRLHESIRESASTVSNSGRRGSRRHP